MAIKPIIINTPENTIQSDAQDWAEIFNSIVGNVSGIMDYGKHLKVNKVNNNTLQILSGVYSMQGHIMRVDESTNNRLTVESGTLGMKRIDLVILEYTKSNDVSKNDEYSIKVLKGTPAVSSSNPIKPTLIQQDILSGGTKRQEELAELLINNTTLTITKQTDFRISNLNTIDFKISKLLDVFYPVGVIFETTSTTSPAETMGGTWERYGNGRVTVGLDSSSDFNTVGKTGGEKTHKLTISEMPSHALDLNRTDTNGDGTRNAVQWSWSNSKQSGGFMKGVGEDEPHNNLQPYIVVYRWRRIA